MTGEPLERWAHVPGSFGLQVSTLGRCDRNGVIVTPSHNKFGYAFVSGRAVHRMVMECFVGPCPAGHEVDHINFVRDDNRLENLQYLTRADNLRKSHKGVPKPMAQRMKMRAAKLGDKHWRAIAPDAARAVELREAGYTIQHVADVLGVSRTTARSVLLGTHWSQRGAA